MEKERKLQIIKTAEKRFVKHGLHKTTLDEIARDLRISKSTLYHYFISKEDLYFTTVRYQADQYISSISGILDKEMPPGENLNEFLEFKSKVFDNYKLIAAMFIHFMNETYFEKESEILKDIYLREEECITKLLPKLNLKTDKQNGSTASTFVNHSWGLVLNNRIVSTVHKDPEKIQTEFLELILNFKGIET